MRSAAFWFLAIGIFAFTPAALSKSNILLCKVDGIQVNGPNARMKNHDGNYVFLDDRGNTIVMTFPDNDPVVFSLVSRRNDWILTAQKDSGTTLSVFNLPDYEGLTMLLTLTGSNGRGVTFKGRCKEN
jgi:hypothetical protein